MALLVGACLLGIEGEMRAASTPNSTSDSCKITCSEDKTVNTDPDRCSASNVTLVAPTIAGSCTISSAKNDAPAEFPKGITKVTWTVIDNKGNTKTCTQNVTVIDQQKPTIDCSSSEPIPFCADASGTAVVTWSNPTVTDNCPGVTVTCVPKSGTIFQTGKTTVTCTAKDTSGNSSQCAFIVTVTKVTLSATKTKIVALCNEPGTTTTITATVEQDPVGSYDWTTASSKIVFVGRTDQKTVIVLGVDASVSVGAEIVHFLYHGQGFCEKDIALTVQQPLSLSSTAPTTTTTTERYETVYSYQILDQFGSAITENLLVSEVTQSACGTATPEHIKPDAKNIATTNGKFSDILGAQKGVTCIRSQQIYVHQLQYPGPANQATPGCPVRRNCLNFSGSSAVATQNTGTGTSQCCQ